MKHNISKQTTILYFVVIIIFIGQIFILNFYKTNDTKLFTEQTQILKKQCDVSNDIVINKLLLIDSDIKRIEQVNDKRFELLGWGLVLLLTTLTALIIVNFVNSKTSLRDVVYDELHGENSLYRKDFDKLIAEMKTKKELLEKEIEKLIQ